METKVLNVSEVGYKTFMSSGRQFYLLNSVFRPKRVHIAEVVVIKDHTRSTRSAISRGANGIIGAILAGFIGVIIAAAASQSTKWDTDLDVILTDGTVVEIRVQEQRFLKRLMPYIAPVDYRTRYRKQRKA